MLPDFFLIGAAKAGTTWLVTCLRRHPDIFMPAGEVHYWTRHLSRVDESHSWYRQAFAEASSGQLLGENSNSYLATPATADIVHAACPNSKIIVSLRNPVERAYSGYCMRYRYGDLDADVERHLDPSRSETPDLLTGGRYFELLRPWLKLFPADQVLVVIHDDLRSEPLRVLGRICTFLGVAEIPEQLDIAGQVNQKGASFPLPLVHRVYARSERIRSLNSRLKGTWLHKLLRRLLMKKITYPELRPAVRSKLQEYYRSDIEQLSNWLGRDLDTWLPRL